jgi:hypothetical protein
VPSDDIYIDALVLTAGLCMAAWGVITLDMTMFAIASLIAGGGVYEMHQRLIGD